MFSPLTALRRMIPATLLMVFIAATTLAGESVELARGGSTEKPQQPQIAIDAQGSVHVVYGVGNVTRYRRSDDGGKTFALPVDLPAANTMALGMRRGPRIAVADKAICASLIGGKQGKGKDGDLLAMQSTDGGNTWTGPVTVNDIEGSAREGLHAMAAGPRGELFCVWLDLRNRSTEIMAAGSTDGGATWSKNTLVYKSPDGSVCECCHPSVMVDEKGRIHVQWRNSLAGSRDIYVVSSSDQGRTFGQAVKMGGGTWRLDACPMDGGAIAPLPNGKVASTWRRENAIFLSLSGQPAEQRLGVGEQPWLAASPKGPFVVWLKKRGETAYLLTPGSTSPSELAKHASDPVIATGPKGRGPVVAAWESRDGKDYTVQLQVVADK